MMLQFLVKMSNFIVLFSVLTHFVGKFAMFPTLLSANEHFIAIYLNIEQSATQN